MKPLILHLAWHSNPDTTSVGPLWNDLLLLCAGLSPLVEPFKEHEVFVDLSGVASADAAVKELLLSLGKASPSRGTDRPHFTVALAPSKFVARVASHVGLNSSSQPTSAMYVQYIHNAIYTQVVASHVREFLAPLSVHHLWCVDPGVCERLVDLGISKLGELSRVPSHRLINEFGTEVGVRLLSLSRGIDPSPVRPLYPPRTTEVYWEFGTEYTLDDVSALTHVLHHLARELATHLEKLGQACSSLVMRMESPTGISGHALKLRHPTSTPEGLVQSVDQLFQKFTLTTSPYRISLIAGDLSLPHSAQPDLFSGRQIETKRRVDQILAGVQKRFGSESIQYAGTLRSSRREQMRAFWHDTLR